MSKEFPKPFEKGYDEALDRLVYNSPENQAQIARWEQDLPELTDDVRFPKFKSDLLALPTGPNWYFNGLKGLHDRMMNLRPEDADLKTIYVNGFFHDYNAEDLRKLIEQQ